MRRPRATICGAILLLLPAVGCGIGGPPSDAALIERFQRERIAFDTLVRMVAEDQVTGEIRLDAMPGETPESTARREAYRRLLKRARCGSAFRDPDGVVRLDVWYPTSGGGVAGTGFIGYAYAPVPPSPIRPALDRGNLERFEDTYRHVDGHWYLWRVRI
jgi:hypothetical protein